MALHHASSGEIVDLGSPGSATQQARSRALVKTDSFEAIRLVLKAGEELPTHKVSGQFSLQCIEGRVSIELADGSLELCPQQWVFLDGGVTHALHAAEDSSLLLTILLPATGGGGV